MTGPTEKGPPVAASEPSDHKEKSSGETISEAASAVNIPASEITASASNLDEEAQPPPASNSTIGALSELLACAWLLNKGYQVFRNVSPNGPYDLVAFKGPEELRIDVKTIRRYGGKPGKPGKYPQAAGARPKQGALLLFVDPATKQCAFETRLLESQP
jgi:hypothetical protein